MSEKESSDFDFGAIQAKAVERMQGRKIVPVPEAIVNLAQESYTGTPGPNGTILHVREFEFDTEERALKFAQHMKNAGDHTKPQTSVTVKIDPDDNGNKKLVRWRTGDRRGRK